MMEERFEGNSPPHESWRLVLIRMEDQVIFFKTKLAHILSTDFDRSHLEYLEVFQHRFLKIDERISWLRHEIRELEEMIQQTDPSPLLQEYIAILQQQLAVKINRTVEGFDILVLDFSRYLHQSFPYLV